MSTLPHTAAPPAGSSEVKETEIAIIGSGLSGVGMAIALRRDGAEDFVVLERAADLGGTWRGQQLSRVRVRHPERPVQLSRRAQSRLDPGVRAAARDPRLHPPRRRPPRRRAVHALRPRAARRRLRRRARPLGARDQPGPVSRPHADLRGGRAGRPVDPRAAGPGHVRRHRVSLGPLEPRSRPDRPSGRGGRHGRLGDPVRSRDPARGRPLDAVSAHPAVGAAARQPHDPGVGAPALRAPSGPAAPRPPWRVLGDGVHALRVSASGDDEARRASRPGGDRQAGARHDAAGQADPRLQPRLQAGPCSPTPGIRRSARPTSTSSPTGSGRSRPTGSSTRPASCTRSTRSSSAPAFTSPTCRSPSGSAAARAARWPRPGTAA